MLAAPSVGWRRLSSAPSRSCTSLFCCYAGPRVCTSVMAVSALVLQGLSLLLGISSGYAIGVAFPRVITPVGAALVWPAWFIAVESGRVRSPIRGSGENGSLLGYGSDLAFMALRGTTIALLIGLTVTAVAFGLRSRRPLWIPLVAFIILGVVFPRGSDYVMRRQALLCVGERVTVCSPPELASRAREALPVVTDTVIALEREGISPRRHYEAWTADADRRHVSWIPLYDPSFIRAPLKSGDIVQNIVAPTSCENWWADEPPSQAWGLAALIAAAHTEKSLGIESERQEMLSAYRRVAGSDYEASIVESIRLLVTCEDGRFPRPISLLAQ